jgi:hypothetical protein
MREQSVSAKEFGTSTPHAIPLAYSNLNLHPILLLALASALNAFLWWLIGLVMLGVSWTMPLCMAGLGLWLLSFFMLAAITNRTRHFSY